MRQKLLQRCNKEPETALSTARLNSNSDQGTPKSGLRQIACFCFPEAKVNPLWRKRTPFRTSILFHTIIQWYLPLYSSPTLVFLRCGNGTDSQEPWPLDLFPYMQGKTGLSCFEIFCLYVWNWTLPHLHCAASSLSHQEVIHLTGEGEIPALGPGNGWTKDAQHWSYTFTCTHSHLCSNMLTAQGRKTLMSCEVTGGLHLGTEWTTRGCGRQVFSIKRVGVQGAQPGALWWPRGVGWGALWGKLKREAVLVYLELIHNVVWQKPTQHCKAIIFRLKINFKKRRVGVIPASHGKIWSACLKDSVGWLGNWNLPLGISRSSAASLWWGGLFGWRISSVGAKWG